MDHTVSQLFLQFARHCALALTFSCLSVLSCGCQGLPTSRMGISPARRSLPLAAMSQAGYCETQWRSLIGSTEQTNPLPSYFSNVPSVREPYFLRSQVVRAPMVATISRSSKYSEESIVPTDRSPMAGAGFPIRRDLTPVTLMNSGGASTDDVRQVPVISAAVYRRVVGQEPDIGESDLLEPKVIERQSLEFDYYR